VRRIFGTIPNNSNQSISVWICLLSKLKIFRSYASLDRLSLGIRALAGGSTEMAHALERVKEVLALTVASIK
jgi:hypothetical protein